MRYQDLSRRKDSAMLRVKKELESLGARYPRLGKLIQQMWPDLVAKYSDLSLTLVDLFFVAKLGLSAVAGAGLITSILQIIQTLVPAPCATTLIRQSTGGTNKIAEKGQSPQAQVEQAVTQIIWLPILLGVGVGVFSLVASGILLLFGPDSEMMRQAVGFLSIAGGFSILGFLVQMERGILRGMNEKKFVTRASLLMNAINGCLNPLLIWQLGLGVCGSALATVFANLFGVIYMWRAVIRRLYGPSTKPERKWKVILLDVGPVKLFMIVSIYDVRTLWQAFIQSMLPKEALSWRLNQEYQKRLKGEWIMRSTSNLISQSTLRTVEFELASFGTLILAAVNITIRIRNGLSYAYNMAIPGAVQIIVGGYYGKALAAEQEKETLKEMQSAPRGAITYLEREIDANCREIVRFCTIGIGLVSVIQGTMWMIQYFFGEWIVSLFTEDPSAIKIALWALPVYIINDTFVGIQRCATESLTGVSFFKGFIAISLLVTSGLLVLGMTIAVIMGWGYQSILYLQLVYTVINATIAVGRFYSRKWIPIPS